MEAELSENKDNQRDSNKSDMLSPPKNLNPWNDAVSLLNKFSVGYVLSIASMGMTLEDTK